MPMDDKSLNWRHKVTLLDREEMTVDGVVNLGSFDEKEVILETEQGVLSVKGEGLNIKQLNLEKGNVILEGAVKSLVYDDAQRAKRGLLERLLK